MKAKIAYSRVAGLIALALASVPSAASAGGRLEANYRLTVAGLPVGAGGWTIDFDDDNYTMAVNGRVTGLMQAFSNGDGTASVRGSLTGTRVAPQSYTINIRTRKKNDTVRMALAGGAVRALSIEPPSEPKPEAIPLSEAHKRGVLDPISAAVIPRGGGDGIQADACQRTLPVFDGRQRYDLAMSYKRTERAQAAGYEGSAVVCRVMYSPVSGHEPNKSGTKFLRETRDIEMWFVPVPGTKFLAMYRIQIPTFIGMAILEPTRFNLSTRSVRPARTQ